jgi:F-type H+-transporting ATPase subunit b
VPPISKAMNERQETIRQTFEDAQAARESAQRAEKEYQEALAETRREVSRLREEAQAERASIIDQARTEAQRRVDEMLASAEGRLATERQQVLLSLRNEIGELAMTLAEKIVHDSLRDDARQRQLVDDFIAGVGAVERVEAEAAG